MFIRMNRPTFAAALRDASSHKDEVRFAAAERLIDATDGEREAALERLRILADDRVGPIRVLALQGLGTLRDADSFALLEARLEDLDYRARQAALTALAEVGGDRALAALTAALSDKRPEMRFQAVAALADINPRLGESAAMDLSADPDPEVRERCAEVLGRIGGARAADALAGQLADPHSTVRIAAALSLANLKDDRGAEELCVALSGREFVVDAAEALGALGVKRAIPILRELAIRWFVPAIVRAAAASALVALGDSDGVSLLRGHVRGFRSEARSYAVSRVAELDVVELVPELVALSARPRGVDLETLAAALRRFEPRSNEAARALQGLVSREPALSATLRPT